MTAWAHLPNAALIDEVLASVRTNPEEWDAARGAARDATWGAARNAVRGAIRDAARDAAWSAARDAAWGATRDAAWGAARDAAQGAVWSVAWGAVAALVAYDDASQFIKLPVDHLQRFYRIDSHPMFLLLQPAAVVFNPRAMSQGSSDEVPLL